MAAERRGRGPLKVVVALVVLFAVVLGVLWIGGNTIGRRWIENRVATELATQLALEQKPSVTLSDPFVAWSVARRRFDALDVHIDRLPVTGQDGTKMYPALDVKLRSIQALDNYSRFVAHDVTADLALGLDALAARTGRPLVATPDGRLQLSYPVTVLGQSITATVTFRPALDPAGRALLITDPQIAIGSLQVPAATASALLASVNKPVDLGLPSALHATSIEVYGNALHLRLAGTDVDLSTLGR